MVLSGLRRRAGQGRGESLLLTRLTKSSMAVDSRQSKMFRAFGDVVHFLLQTCAADEVIAISYNEVANFR